MNNQVYVFTKSQQIVSVDFNQLVTIGGGESTGLRVQGLKKKNDYVLLKKTNQQVRVNNLLKQQSEFLLEPFKLYTINDLSLFLIPSAEKNMDYLSKSLFKNFHEKLAFFLQKIHSKSDLSVHLNQIISYICESLKFDKAILIQLDANGVYKTCSGYNLKDNENWLSETLIEECFNNDKAVFVSNVIGSGYDSKKSIIASNFLSFFSFPIKNLDQNVGLLVLGSELPYKDDQLIQNNELACLVNLLGITINHQKEISRLESKIESISLSESTPFNTNDSRFLKQIDLAQQVAKSNISVLINGETGVGKEVMAKWIHSCSLRSSKKFVAINCGAIPENLIESILFGHKKGAFTGAISDQVGKIEYANGGTLFFDEIGDLPPSAQVKLLRVLQERVVEPIGAKGEKFVDIRVIAATHKSLHKLVEKGSFREDLYYRLAEIQIEIPPLVVRPDDIVLIASEYMSKNYPHKQISPEAMAWMREYSWCGNVRELISFLKRATTISVDDRIQVSDLTLGAPERTFENDYGWLGGKNLEEARQKFVHEKIKMALEIHKGNKTQAAQALGVSPRTMFRYLEN